GGTVEVVREFGIQGFKIEWIEKACRQADHNDGSRKGFGMVRKRILYRKRWCMPSRRWMRCSRKKSWGGSAPDSSHSEWRAILFL
ncbi:MAG: hypothetical protein AB7K24_19825, partial [Gemmataceae bacterium]